MSRRWRVEAHYSEVIEAEDEGEALMKADQDFSIMSDARAEEIEDEDE